MCGERLRCDQHPKSFQRRGHRHPLPCLSQAQQETKVAHGKLLPCASCSHLLQLFPLPQFVCVFHESMDVVYHVVRILLKTKTGRRLLRASCMLAQFATHAVGRLMVTATAKKTLQDKKDYTLIIADILKVSGA